jgi:hypothetical protein
MSVRIPAARNARAMQIDPPEKLARRAAFRTELVQAAVNADRYSDALSWMGKIDAEDQGPEHWWRPEILRLKGALALSVDRDAAKSLFRQSLTLVQKQGSLAWEVEDDAGFE